jgi:hypothetical protein
MTPRTKVSIGVAVLLALMTGFYMTIIKAVWNLAAWALGFFPIGWTEAFFLTLLCYTIEIWLAVVIWDRVDKE